MKASFRQDGKLTDPWTGIAFCRVSNRGFGFSRERGLDYFLDCRGPRKLLHIVKILEIIRAVWTELGNRDYTANCSSRFLRLRYAGVADGAVIVVGEHDDPGFRKLGPERFGNGAEVAAVERDRHRVAGGFVRAGTGRVTLADQDHVGRSADGEVATPDATAKEELLAAVFSDELQALQQPFGIPNRHHDVAARNADAMRQNPLAVDIRVLGAGWDVAPYGVSTSRGFDMAPRFFGFPLSAGDLRLLAKVVSFCSGQGSPYVHRPGFPSLSVAPVLETAGWDAIEMQQVRGIAFATAPLRVAAVKLTVADNVPGQDDAALP